MGGEYDPKQRSLLAALLADASARKNLGGPASTLPQHNALASALFPSGLLAPAPHTAPVKRRAYFAFKFSDVWRVNVVRNAWKIAHPDSPLMRSFYDSSIWETRKMESEDSLKKLMRENIEYTSAVCVLVGAETWSSRWVKYEIARSVIDGRGLLAVHINSLNHHQRGKPDPKGYNPLQLLGIYKAQNGNFYLCEYQKVVVNALSGETEWRWLKYSDYLFPVSLPRYLSHPNNSEVRPLSAGAAEYDYVAQEGHKNIGLWIDQAAKAVGR